ncbi:MAG: DNA-processing protein DprA, partial [Desulfovibrio fairfieldensis]|nr:DNA-processing protein DprA [Desulfovibrio fairfieldensis]
NRIISGLALGVLVVEAASRSGSLITARLALDQNRDVYAVPGPALDSHCLGCQELVRQGARPVFSAEDVLRDLAAQLQPFGISEASLPEAEKALTLPVRAGEDTNPGQAAAPSEKNRGVGSAVPPIPVEIPCAEAEALVPPDRKERLLHCLRGQGPMQVDALAVALDMPIHELNALLIGLEMLGRVKRLPGARYEALA